MNIYPLDFFRRSTRGFVNPFEDELLLHEVNKSLRVDPRRPSIILGSDTVEFNHEYSLGTLLFTFAYEYSLLKSSRKIHRMLVFNSRIRFFRIVHRSACTRIVETNWNRR